MAISTIAFRVSSVALAAVALLIAAVVSFLLVLLRWNRWLPW
jgi:hypothetical protein